MKKVLMTAMLAVTLMGIMANANGQKGFNFSFKVTPQFTWLQNSDDDEMTTIDLSPLIRASFGVGAGYHFTDNYGIGLDLLYSLQGQEYKEGGDELLIKLDYVKVPIYFTYNSDPSQDISFVGKIGPVVNFLTTAQWENEGVEIDVDEVYSDVTVGAMVNAGIQFRLGPKMYLQTGLNFDYDIANAEDVDYVDFPAGRASTHNMTMGLQVGLKYLCGK